MNHSRNLLLSAVAATLLSAPLAARADVAIELNVAPPAPVYEAVPPPREGYVWAQGYWDYEGTKHVWHKGSWEREHPGERWHQSEWVHDGEHWRLDRGHWEHDH